MPESTFDALRYKKNQVGNKDDLPYADGSDAYANRGFYVSFLHVPSNSSLKFKAFITAFNETYTPNWQSEEVFGRADPIHTFKQTSRAINLTFMVPAASESEAYENLGKTQNLTQFVYPNYTNVQEAQTISQGPLIRLKVMNLLENHKSAENENIGKLAKEAGFKKEDYYQLYSSQGTDANKGLLGFISSLTINHNVENREAGVFEKSENTILPKLIEIVISFTPIHEHALGWNNENRFSNQLFPYGTFLYDPANEPAPDVPATPAVPPVSPDAQLETGDIVFQEQLPVLEPPEQERVAEQAKAAQAAASLTTTNTVTTTRAMTPAEQLKAKVQAYQRIAQAGGPGTSQLTGLAQQIQREFAALSPGSAPIEVEDFGDILLVNQFQ